MMKERLKINQLQKLSSHENIFLNKVNAVLKLNQQVTRQLEDIKEVNINYLKNYRFHKLFT